MKMIRILNGRTIYYSVKVGLEFMDGIRVFNISEIGSSHITTNKGSQDSSNSYCDKTMAIAIACDGHGGDKYFRSNRGSKFAAEITLKSFKECMDYENQFIEKLKENPDKVLGQLEQNIIANWNSAVVKDFDEDPFNEEELSKLPNQDRLLYEQKQGIESAYGTTIIAFLLTEKFCFGLHIGDGKCFAVYENGEFKQPIPWDDKCFLNVTTSICDTNAFSNFRNFFSEELPVAVFVGTDGIDDSFATDDQLQCFYKTVISSFITSSFEIAVRELNLFLPKLSAKGSGDDVSVAAILNLTEIKRLKDLFVTETKVTEEIEVSQVELIKKQTIVSIDSDNFLTDKAP